MMTNVKKRAESERSVLVVDDDGPILRALQARLKHAGYSVSAARDGATAVLTLGDTKPDVAVLDINMPGLDGFSIAEKLKKALPDIGLVFLTASKAPRTREKAEALGGAFFEKPFDSKQLIEQIGSHYA